VLGKSVLVLSKARSFLMKRFGVLALALTMFTGAAIIGFAQGTDTTKKTTTKKKKNKKKATT